MNRGIVTTLRTMPSLRSSHFVHSQMTQDIKICVITDRLIVPCDEYEVTSKLDLASSLVALVCDGTEMTASTSIVGAIGNKIQSAMMFVNNEVWLSCHVIFVIFRRFGYIYIHCIVRTMVMMVMTRRACIWRP